MASNSKLAIAVHAAGILAVRPRTPVSSVALAESVKTNPVVVRRILRVLAKSGLVEVTKGSGGGACLAREPESISVAEIYLALGEDDLFQVPELGEEHCCRVGREVRPILKEFFSEAESALTGYLETISLADVMRRVRERVPDGCDEELIDGGAKGR